MNAPPTVQDSGDLLQRLDQLLEIGVALSSERDINKLLESILVAAKSITNADGGTLYPQDRRQRPQIRDRAQRHPRHRHGRHERRADTVQSRGTFRRAGQTRALDGRRLRRASRLLGQHRRRLYRERIRLLGHQALRRENRIPLAVVSDHTDQEPRERDHRRSSADQRKGPRDRHGAGLFRGRSAPRGIARFPGGHRAHEPAPHQPPRSPLRVLHQGDQRRDRRQVSLYRRALRARAYAHDDAGGSGQQVPVRTAPGFHDE